MSTKTLKKRIALVAVSALTAGFLSVASAPVANAISTTAITAPNIFMSEPASAGAPGAVGQCAIDATARGADVTTSVSTGTVLAVGGSVTFDTTTNGTGNLTIVGPATFALGATITTQTISQDAKSVGFADNINTVGTLTVTGVGDIVVTAKNSATKGTGTAVKTFGITAVAACSDADTVNVANSSLTVQSAANQNKGTTGDDTLTGAEKSYSVVQHIAVVLQNAYKSNLSTNVLLTAEATNGALVGWDTTGVASTAFKSDSVAGVAGNVDVHVSQDTVKAPGAALTTTVTVKANGVTIGSKTLTLFGAPAKIVIDQADVTTGTAAGTGAFKYTVVDNAGNNLNTNEGLTPAFGNITAAAAGWEAAIGSVVTGATATTPDITSTTKGTGTFACVAAGTGASGTVDIYVGGAYRAGIGLVKSNTFKATCGDSAIRSWTASMDKAVYSPGEIATLTISAKDRNGGIVGDTAAIGAAFNQISIPGMTIIGSAISAADVFTAGAKTYKFRVDQAEGSFVGQAQVTVDAASAAAEKVVKTLQFSIKSSSGAVSNADVLKSIVALIASINKQIQALQKLILKR